LRKKNRGVAAVDETTTTTFFFFFSLSLSLCPSICSPSLKSRFSNPQSVDSCPFSPMRELDEQKTNIGRVETTGENPMMMR